LFRRTSRRRDRTRAQGLVEFALIAPVLLVLLLVAIDFGRALYGWVVLQNSARIAANFAGLNADAWRYNVATTKARYAVQITADLQAANCTSFGSGGGSGTPPDPTFVDGPDQAAAGGPADTIYDVGDVARVTLTCVFHPLTPVISAVLGNSVQLTATSEFQIRTGSVTGLANPTEIPPPGTPLPSASASASASVPACVIVPDLTHDGGASETVSQARTEWFGAGFNANTFSPPNGQTNKIVDTQTTTPGASVGQCVSPTTTVTVTFH
jgi:hypothetical protein